MATRTQGDIDTVGQERRDEPLRARAHKWERDAWEHTDRLLSFLPATTELPVVDQADAVQIAREQWLVENGVITEFLDGGIGCCWFAHSGDREPVTGETQDDAIARLAREQGLTPPPGSRRSLAARTP